MNTSTPAASTPATPAAVESAAAYSAVDPAAVEAAAVQVGQFGLPLPVDDDPHDLQDLEAQVAMLSDDEINGVQPVDDPQPVELLTTAQHLQPVQVIPAAPAIDPAILAAVIAAVQAATPAAPATPAARAAQPVDDTAAPATPAAVEPKDKVGCTLKELSWRVKYVKRNTGHKMPISRRGAKYYPGTQHDRKTSLTTSIEGHRNGRTYCRYFYGINELLAALLLDDKNRAKVLRHLKSTAAADTDSATS